MNPSTNEADHDQPMFLRIPVKCRQLIIDTLRSAGFAQEATAVIEFTKNYVDPEMNAYRKQVLARARKLLEKEGEIEFDEDANISCGDDPGCYVMAWVWLYDDECEDDGCPKCDPDCLGRNEDCHDACEWPDN